MSIATMTPDMEKALRYHWINKNDSKFVIKYNNIIKPVDSIKANRDCKFGIRCNRENCWFRHPKGRWIKKEVTKEFDSFYDAKNTCHLRFPRRLYMFNQADILIMTGNKLIGVFHEGDAVLCCGDLL